MLEKTTDTSHLKLGAELATGAGVRRITQLWKYEVQYREEIPGFRPRTRFCTVDEWERMRKEASQHHA